MQAYGQQLFQHGHRWLYKQVARLARPTFELSAFNLFSYRDTEVLMDGNRPAQGRGLLAEGALDGNMMPFQRINSTSTDASKSLLLHPCEQSL